jgi:hypothetical protein
MRDASHYTRPLIQGLSGLAVAAWLVFGCSGGQGGGFGARPSGSGSSGGGSSGGSSSGGSSGGASSSGGVDGGSCQGADLLDDPHNCGECAHDCIAGACLGGACQPYVVVPSGSYTGSLASDGTLVYVLNANRIDAVPVRGGTPASWAVSSPGTSYDWLFGDPLSHALFAFTDTQAIVRFDGGVPTPTTVVPPGGASCDGHTLWLRAMNTSPWPWTADATNVYWVTPQNALFAASKTGGGGARRVTPDASFAPFGVTFANIVARDGYVYGNDPLTAHAIRRITAADGSITDMLPDTYHPDQVAITSQYLVWSGETNGTAVDRMELSSLAVSTVGTAGTVSVIADESYVYAFDGYRVQRLPLAGGPTTTLAQVATGNSVVATLVQDDRAIYWNTVDGYADHGVMGLAK